MSGYVDPILGPRWAILGLVGPCWAILGPSWGAMLGLVGAMLGRLSRVITTLRESTFYWRHFGVGLSHGGILILFNKLQPTSCIRTLTTEAGPAFFPGIVIFV